MAKIKVGKLSDHYDRRSRKRGAIVMLARNFPGVVILIRTYVIREPEQNYYSGAIFQKQAVSGRIVAAAKRSGCEPS
jgi:hypothetical protein